MVILIHHLHSHHHRTEASHVDIPILAPWMLLNSLAHPKSPVA